ncbi:MAG: B12-binding domain-containing radical SAM protein [Candidatus Omnitrophica bacterium]|nr:B12-binding domain-containing radical SAM protein [Candidatus Omnitrophota bacterium]
MKFKVAFIYPGYENLGIEHLSALLKKCGFETKLFLDPVLFAESAFLNSRVLAGIFSYRKKLLRRILEYQPDMVCFSVITDNYQWAKGWAAEIKRHLSVPVVFGGIHPSAVPERVILEPCVDYLCIGEGDEAIVELAAALSGAGATDAIMNIWTKKEGAVVRNRIRPPIDDLDRLPPADKELFYTSAPVFNKGYILSTSRGCPYSCSYCCNDTWKAIYAEEKKFLRRRSPAAVIAELGEAKAKYAPRYVSFWDEVFNADKAWLDEFLPRYKREIGLPFFCFAFPDLVTPELAGQLKEAGCYKVQMGVQTIDEEKRRGILKRNSSNEAITKAIGLLKGSGIYVTCDTILGLPGEDGLELERTAQFYSRNLPDHIEIFWLRYYPKTQISCWAMEQGLLNPVQMQDIEEGRAGYGIVRGKGKPSKESKRFMALFYLFHFLPYKMRKWILESRAHRYLPAFFPPIALYIASRLFNRAKFDVNIERTIKRYAYFASRRILPDRAASKKQRSG